MFLIYFCFGKRYPHTLTNNTHKIDSISPPALRTEISISSISKLVKHPSVREQWSSFVWRLWRIDLLSWVEAATQKIGCLFWLYRSPPPYTRPCEVRKAVLLENEGEGGQKRCFPNVPALSLTIRSLVPGRGTSLVPKSSSADWIRPLEWVVRVLEWTPSLLLFEVKSFVCVWRCVVSSTALLRHSKPLVWPASFDDNA